MFIVNLRIGDRSNDGHGDSIIVTIESNLSITDLKSAFQKGSESIDIDLYAVACDYQDPFISFEDQEALEKAGFKFPEIIEYDPDYGNGIDTNVYTEIWLFVVKTGNPNFKYKIVNSDLSIINIGGYGLFD
jgi:hypothetical protein